MNNQYRSGTMNRWTLAPLSPALEQEHYQVLPGWFHVPLPSNPPSTTCLGLPATSSVFPIIRQVLAAFDSAGYPPSRQAGIHPVQTLAVFWGKWTRRFRRFRVGLRGYI